MCTRRCSQSHEPVGRALLCRSSGSRRRCLQLRAARSAAFWYARCAPTYGSTRRVSRCLLRWRAPRRLRQTCARTARRSVWPRSACGGRMRGGQTCVRWQTRCAQAVSRRWMASRRASARPSRRCSGVSRARWTRSFARWAAARTCASTSTTASGCRCTPDRTVWQFSAGTSRRSPRSTRTCARWRGGCRRRELRALCWMRRSLRWTHTAHCYPSSGLRRVRARVLRWRTSRCGCVCTPLTCSTWTVRRC